MKKINNKKAIILGISIVLFISVIVAIILLLTSNNKTAQTSSDSVDTINAIEQIVTEQTVPSVNKDNTTFKISDTKKKVETVNISAGKRLTDYNLYYCIKFGDENVAEIKNEDYIVFNDLILVIEENCSILFKYELNGNYSNEPYIVKISNIKAKENTVKVSEKDLEKEKVDKKDKTQSTSPYFVKVNYTANVVTIYSKDNDGNYTVPYKVMVCSCGTYTPKSGTYKTTNKYVWRPLINNVYGHYATRIVNKILFHSVPYTSSSNDALEYWEYDKLGQTASEGCVRLTVRDAKWIYNNCPSGTMVEFYSSSNPGPLGKPSAQKISSNVECRNWDPTDPANGNPWRTYKEEKEPIKEEASKNNNVTDNTVINTTTNTSNSTNANNTVNNTVINNNTTANNTTTENNNTVTKPSTNNTTQNNATTNSTTQNTNSTKPLVNTVIQNQV